MADFRNIIMCLIRNSTTCLVYSFVVLQEVAGKSKCAICIGIFFHYIFSLRFFFIFLVDILRYYLEIILF